MTYDPVDNSELVAVVTFLDMASPPADPPPSSDLSFRRLSPTPDEYRTLFRLVGSRWLWFSRLLMDDQELAAIIDDPGVEIFEIVDSEGKASGMIELDFRQLGECEIGFLGLVPGLAGKGHGRWLLAETLRRAWRPGIGRVHVHTCSLDHPAALTAYRRAGFTPYRRALERFADPRLIGALPKDCAPQVPLLGTDGSTRSPDS